MKILTIATERKKYFTLLEQTARDWGYELNVLGWGLPWKGLAWKIELYIEGLKNIPQNEPVVCVDGYDVVVVGAAHEMYDKFIKMHQPIIFSEQQYFPNQKWLKKIADQVMENEQNTDGYSRACTGLLVGYAGTLCSLFKHLREIEKSQSIGNDQILLNLYASKYPKSVHLDTQCIMFQNLWRTRRGIYGKISPNDDRCEVEISYDKKSKRKRIKNKKYNTLSCFIHAPFNLDMNLILNDLGLKTPELGVKNGWHYWQYSIMYYISRGIKFYQQKIIMAISCLIIALIIIMTR